MGTASRAERHERIRHSSLHQCSRRRERCRRSGRNALPAPHGDDGGSRGADRRPPELFARHRRRGRPRRRVRAGDAGRPCRLPDLPGREPPARRRLLARHGRSRGADDPRVPGDRRLLGAGVPVVLPLRPAHRGGLVPGVPGPAGGSVLRQGGRRLLARLAGRMVRPRPRLPARRAHRPARPRLEPDAQRPLRSAHGHRRRRRARRVDDPRPEGAARHRHPARRHLRRPRRGPLARRRQRLSEARLASTISSNTRAAPASI